MTRRRPPQYDYICQRCGCACDAGGTRHLGGGSRGMCACGKPPDVVLRSDFDRDVGEVVDMLRSRIWE